MPQLIEDGGENLKTPQYSVNDELKFVILASWDNYDDEDNDIEDDDLNDEEDPFDKEPSDSDIFDNDVPFGNPEDDLSDDENDDMLYNRLHP
jgi:hypothetical protein